MTRITIISGFLGVGKTTFANRLLDYYIRNGEKTAYIVNEFGQTGLDSALIEKQGFQTVDIFGGCICCTLRGKITEALRDVIEKFEPARIVFEPSGVFIFEKFLDVLEDEYLKGRCAVDNVITITDSTHTTDAMLVPGNFFANQVAHADTVIISKLESFNGDIKALTESLGALNRQAGILAKPWSALRDADYAKLHKNGSAGILADEECAPGGHDHHAHEHGDHAHGDGDHAHGDGDHAHGDGDHAHEHGDHAHEHEDHGLKHDEMDSVTIVPKDLDAATVRELRRLLAEGNFGKVYRIKGKVRYEGGDKVLQAAFDSMNFDEGAPEGDPGLTFIGNGLNVSRIRSCWGRG